MCVIGGENCGAVSVGRFLLIIPLLSGKYRGNDGDGVVRVSAVEFRVQDGVGSGDTAMAVTHMAFSPKSSGPDSRCLMTVATLNRCCAFRSIAVGIRRFSRPVAAWLSEDPTGRPPGRALRFDLYRGQRKPEKVGT